MLIASVKSDRFPVIEKINTLPVFSDLIVACCAMLPMFVIQELVQEIFGRDLIFDLSFTFFFNNFCLHLFLTFILDIRVKLFFVPITLFCLFCTILNGYREWDLILELLNR